MSLRLEFTRRSGRLSFKVAMTIVAALVSFSGIAAAQKPDPAKAAQAKPPKPAAAPAISPLLRRAREFVARQVAVGDLRGSWFQVDEKNGVFQVEPFLDVSQAEKQVLATKGLMSGLQAEVPDTKFELREPVLRPVSQLVEDLQHDIEASMSFPGVGISRAVFTIRENTDSVLMSLQGRVGAEDQRDAIRERCLKLMINDRFWSKRGADGTPEYQRAYADADQLKVVLPSPTFSSRLFNRGLQLFRQGDTAAARQHFRAAMVESNSPATRHYWLVLCELKLGKTERARNLLREPFNRIRNGRLEYDSVLRSLQRIQGPLRWELIALENSILLDEK